MNLVENKDCDFNGYASFQAAKVTLFCFFTKINTNKIFMYKVMIDNHELDVYKSNFHLLIFKKIDLSYSNLDYYN